ncbi:MAG TPA: class I SAM-dependent methyltransferase [Pyrinomonadaceae bacterium]
MESKSGVGLIFAPEKSLESVWTQATRLRVYRVDIETARGVDVLADIQRLPFATDSVDFIWCHHVLTQIENDHLAMKELYRVLRPRTGELVLSAATTDSPATEEFGFANKDLLGFWRIYGRDFADRIAGNGFQVQAVRFELPVEESQRYATAGAEEFYLCVKPDLS